MSEGGLLFRYRTLAVALATVTLIVTVADRPGEPQSNVAASLGGTPRVGAAPGQVNSPGGGEGSAGPSVNAAGGSRPAAGPSSGDGTVAGPQASGDVAYPGIGTPEALANPSCDSERGLMAFPSLWSPPCVVPWPEGAHNGGATATGVTADSIRILVRLGAGDEDEDDEDTKQQIQDTWAIWNHHMELWGRQLDFVFYKPASDDEVAQRAQAIEAYNTHKPFMVISLYNALGASPRVWSTELAARGVVVFDVDMLFSDAQAQPGFRWAYAMDDGMHARLVGEWVGKRLVGTTARWAGDLAMQTQPRTFGMVYPGMWNKELFDAESRGYGFELVEEISYEQGSETTRLQEQARTVIGRLKSAGVTSVVAVTDWLFTALLTTEASAQQYRPEWIITGWNLQDLVLFSQTYDQEQWSHAFGIGLIPLLTKGPTWEQNQLFEWEYGRQPEQTATNGNMYLYARDVVPAMQLAGPNLTPETFRQAMFLKPPAGAPWNDGRITTGTSYGRQWLNLPYDDYSGYDGMNEAWWDPTAIGQEEAAYTEVPGAYRRLHGGKYYPLGGFGTGEPPMFDPSIAPAQRGEVPPEDQAPQYPHREHES